MEVSFLLPLLIALTMGTVDLGRYAYQGILIGNAAEAGAAYGAQGLVFSANTTGIQTAATNDYQNNGQNAGTLTVSSTTACGCDNAGAITTANCSSAVNPSAGTCNAGHWVVMVQVTATGAYTTLFPYPGIPATMTITKTTTMRVAEN